MPWWTIASSGVGATNVISDSEIILVTGSTLNDYITLNFGVAVKIWIKEDELIFEGVGGARSTFTELLVKFGFGPVSPTDYVYFKCDDSIGPNWLAVIHNTSEQVLDTGVLVNGDAKVFRIEQNATAITFYMGDVGGALSQVAQFTSDLPNKATDVGAYVEALSASPRQFNVDYIEVVGDR